MIPLPVNPNAAILIQDGKIAKIATNVAPDFQVTIVNDEASFNQAALGKPFNFTPNVIAE